MEPDDLKDSFYLHITRTSGVARRHEPTLREQLPKRLEGLSRKLEEPNGAPPVPPIMRGAR
jgi:hypothetical protein